MSEGEGGVRAYTRIRRGEAATQSLAKSGAVSPSETAAPLIYALLFGSESWWVLQH